MKNEAFKYSIANGVWINDLRSKPFADQEWPCITLDRQSINDIKDNIKLQSENGFNSLTLFGLLTGDSWLPKITETIDEERKNAVKEILKFAKEQEVKIFYGLGVYSWGFGKIIEHNPTIRATNNKVMCGSNKKSFEWMKQVINYIINEYDFDCFHLEAADLGRCFCTNCATKSDSEYFCEINTKTAQYISNNNPNTTLIVSLCGYLSKGMTVPKEEWKFYQEMSKYIDCLIDPGHFGTFIPLDQRKEFIKTLDCEFGSGSGIWLYPPSSWERLKYFIPYTMRAGKYLEELYKDGGSGVEYNLGPIINPAIEVNIVFGGHKLNNINKSNEEILFEVINQIYKPKNSSASKALVDFYINTEEAFFSNLKAAYSDPETLLPSEIHLTYLYGNTSKIAVYLTDTAIEVEHEWYLTKTMPKENRLIYKEQLQEAISNLIPFEQDIVNQECLGRIKICINDIIEQIND